MTKHTYQIELRSLFDTFSDEVFRDLKKNVRRGKEVMISAELVSGSGLRITTEDSQK